MNLRRPSLVVYSASSHILGCASRCVRENFFRCSDIYCQAPGLSSAEPTRSPPPRSHEVKVSTGCLAVRYPGWGPSELSSEVELAKRKVQVLRVSRVGCWGESPSLVRAQACKRQAASHSVVPEEEKAGWYDGGLSGRRVGKSSLSRGD